MHLTVTGPVRDRNRIRDDARRLQVQPAHVVLLHHAVTAHYVPVSLHQFLRESLHN